MVDTAWQRAILPRDTTDFHVFTNLCESVYDVAYVIIILDCMFGITVDVGFGSITRTTRTSRFRFVISVSMSIRIDSI